MTSPFFMETMNISLTNLSACTGVSWEKTGDLARAHLWMLYLPTLRISAPRTFWTSSLWIDRIITLSIAIALADLLLVS